jgi:hypothetical protein
MRTIFASILAAFAVVALAVLPASAAMKPAHPNVFLVNENGKITTPCVVHAGEALTGIGYVSGPFIITSVTPDGPVDLVTLNRAVPKGVLDFTS